MPIEYKGGIKLLNYPISVFLDTNIFIGAKYDFSSKGIFSTLNKYISDGKIKLFISNIVEEEAKKHLNEDAVILCNSFKDARTNVLKKLSSNILDDTSVANLFKKLEKDELKSEMGLLFDKFIEESKAIVLDNSGVDCNQIVSDYFSGTLPFETKDGKKYEFPDAIMAAKLKLLFNVENPVYIVSNDSGFRTSLNKKNSFNTFESLKEVFNLINMETNIYEDITSFILNSDTHKLICNMFTEELNNKDIDIDGLDCDRKGLCEGYDYEEVCIDDISQVDFEFGSVDDITEDTVNITLSCKATITATCSYIDESNSAWDTEEDEYVFSEWASVEEKHQPNFDCEVSFSINRKGEEINFKIESIDFNILLDQWTRVSRQCIEPEDPAEVAKAEEKEAFEEYYKH